MSKCYCDSDAVDATAALDARDCDLCKENPAYKWISDELGALCKECINERNRKKMVNN